MARKKVSFKMVLFSVLFVTKLTLVLDSSMDCIKMISEKSFMLEAAGALCAVKSLTCGMLFSDVSS